MKYYLHIWRQKPKEKGRLVPYELEGISGDMSFLEMLDVLNESLVARGEEPIAFDHDCREGICGACSLMINGVPHGPKERTTTCQLHMRSFPDGSKIVIEPWYAAAFPVIKDLVTDRSAFDRIIGAGGYVSVSTGSAPEAHTILVSKEAAERAMDGAECIGCGACVAGCKNASAMLFVAAKVAHLGHLPQGQVEGPSRVLNMVAQMDAEGFGPCSQTYECEAVCPKGISGMFIAELNQAYRKTLVRGG